MWYFYHILPLFLLPICCPFAAHLLPICCPFAAHLLPICCPFAAHLLPIRCYENAGRMSATYGTGSMTTYRFIGKNVPVKPMPAILLPLMEQAIKTIGVSFNWVHVVYYPDGNCKLDWHADNEKTIARGSTIVGFTMYENPTYIRPIEIRRKPEPKVKSVNTKRKTSVDLTTIDCAKKTCMNKK
jgi:hypothetical protein